MATREDVERIARLARIRLKPAEIDSVQAKFTKILEHFEFLKEVDTTGVEPMFHATEAMELRADEPVGPIPREKLLSNAPESFEGCFRIPRVVGGEE